MDEPEEYSDEESRQLGEAAGDSDVEAPPPDLLPLHFDEGSDNEGQEREISASQNPAPPELPQQDPTNGGRGRGATSGVRSTPKASTRWGRRPVDESTDESMHAPPEFVPDPQAPHGPTFSLTADELEHPSCTVKIFDRLFPPDLRDEIAEQTNLYIAQQVIAKLAVRPKGCITYKAYAIISPNPIRVTDF